MPFSEFVKVQRKDVLCLSFRQFADGLNNYLPEADRITRQAVYEWERGGGRPTYSAFYYIHQHAPEGSWQHEFARRGMEILQPVEIPGEQQ